MSTKSELENYLKSEFGMVSEDGTIFVADYNLGNGRSQRAMAILDEDQLIVASPFAREGQVTADKIFDTAGLPVMKFGDLYCSARVFPMANLQTDEVDFMISVTTISADNLERELGLGDDF